MTKYKTKVAASKFIEEGFTINIPIAKKITETAAILDLLKRAIGNFQNITLFRVRI